MANKNDRPKLSTCPICGYTDTADDPEALQSAIEEHIRMAHNLDPATLGNTGATVKPVTNEVADEAGANYGRNESALPVVPVAANSGGTGAAPTAPNAVYAPNVLANEDTLDTPETRERNEHRHDQMDNFS